jgi:hypothetical protein
MQENAASEAFMWKNIAGVIAGVIVLVLIFYFTIVNLFSTPQDPDFLEDRVATLDQFTILEDGFTFQVRVPSGWYLLRVPNEYLNYPEAPVQMISEKKDAFCLVIPEQIETEGITLEELADIYKDTVNQTYKQVSLISEESRNTAWSQRTQIHYSAQEGVHEIQYLMQLDFTDQIAVRILCWCTEEKYNTYQSDFQSIFSSLQLTPKR